jgi:hypothetical protein
MNLAVELLAAPVVACGAAGAITLLYVHNAIQHYAAAFVSPPFIRSNTAFSEADPCIC